MAEPSPAGMAVAGTTTSAWTPFRSRVFAVMWIALLVSHVGTWMRDVGAGWLMTSLSTSATAVALVQAATTLPIFLLSLPAGALADIVDRRRLLIALCIAMSAVSWGLAGATQAGWIDATGLIAALLLAGVGTAMMTPVLQSLTPLMVDRALLRQAIALNSMGLNVSRAIGPAIGGLVVAGAGVAWTFVADALSWLTLIAALWWWRGAGQRAAVGPAERLWPAMQVGLRFAWHAPALQRVLLRAGCFFLFASAYWALLPLLVRRQLDGNAADYGLLMASIGSGAVAGALALPSLRRRLSGEAMVQIGTILTVVVLAALALTREVALAAGALALAGAAWIWVLTTANVAAQGQLPNWVRGRGLAVYLTVFYGAMTVGSFLWGRIADTTSLPVTLLLAAALGVPGLVLGRLKPLPAAEPDLAPAGHWPEPALTPGAFEAASRRGPVLVTIEYDIEAHSTAAFLLAAHALSGERLRDGAYDWGLFEDAAVPGRWLECFRLPDWQEHLRQHRRVTRDDELAQRRMNALQRGGKAPVVRHLLAP